MIALEIADHGQEAPPAHIPFTLPARQVLERSLPEALHSGTSMSAPSTFC